MVAIWFFLGISACSSSFVVWELCHAHRAKRSNNSVPRTLVEIRRSSTLDFKAYRERQEARVAEALELLGVDPGHWARGDIEDHIYDFLESGFPDEAEELERLHTLVNMELQR